MNKISSRARMAGRAALVAGLAVLAGCGPAPYSTTTTHEQVTTTTPAPVVSTTTTTTHEDSKRN